MGLPKKLKNMNAHVDGEGYLGKIAEFEEPKLALATEDWRGGGMIGPWIRVAGRPPGRPQAGYLHRIVDMYLSV